AGRAHHRPTGAVSSARVAAMTGSPASASSRICRPGHFQVLYQSPSGAGNYSNGPLNLNGPCEKDTVSLHPRAHLVIQWKEDNPGLRSFHGHIEWHLAKGMGVVIHSTEAGR